MLSSSKVKQLVQNYFEENKNIEFGYIFGSYADETFNNRSDVDVAIYLKEGSFDIELSIHFELSRLLDKDVDLVILNKAKNLYLLEDIVTKGILLKDHDKRFDFEIRKHHQYIDYIEFKKRINAS
jgi:predicted nucleotidyltransferase